MGDRVREASKWRIYSNMVGGWFAWNAEESKRTDLVSYGAFTEALREFERAIGPYYESRPGVPHPGEGDG